MYFYSSEDPEDLTETITDYVKFCENHVTAERTIHMFPSNTPWVTCVVKDCLMKNKKKKKKKRAFPQKEVCVHPQGGEGRTALCHHQV